MIKVNNQLIILIFLISFFIYGPFIYKGGFGPQDDLVYVNQALGKTNIAQLTKDRVVYGTDYVASREVASRPVGMLGLTIANVLFQDNPTPYIIIQLSLWILCIINLSYTLKQTLGDRASLMFILLGQFPIFASTIVFSSFRFGEYGLSVFFWTLSLIFQHKYILNRRLYNYFTGYILLMLGLLSLSIILPLLVISALLPIIYENKQINDSFKKDIIKYGWQYIFPVILVAFIFFIYKVYGIRLYNIDSIPKGLETGISINSFIKCGYYFFVILFEVPIMLIDVIPHLENWYILIILALVFSYFRTISNFKDKSLLKSKDSTNKLETQFIVLVTSTLAFGSVIFFISGYPTVTFGGYNRMLLPSFLLLTIIVSYCMCRTLNTKWIYMSIVISFLWISSMNVQISNFVASWEIRHKVYKDWSSRMKNTNLGSKPYVLACVPFFTINNYNNEEVFLAHFYKAGLSMYGIDEVDGEVISWRSVSRNDNYMTVLNFPETFIKPENLWYYEYDGTNSESKLEKINTQLQLDSKLKQITVNNINYHPIIFREKILMKFRALAMNN